MLFWEQKGISRWLLEPELHLKVDKVDSLFRLNLEQEYSKRLKEQIETEKKLLPELVEECLDWAEKEQLKKITKSNLDYFLIDKESELTVTSRDILYHRVNLKLKRK
jgi:hypothetical protein